MKLLECWKPLKYYRTSSGIIEEFPEIEVTVLGKFRYSSSKRAISILTKGTDYPVISIYLHRGGVLTTTRLQVHTAIISTFSVTDVILKPGLNVDHIDRDKNNYSLNNLRFLSISDNLKNRNKFSKPKVYLYLDTNYNILKVSNKLEKCSNSLIVSFTEDSYSNIIKTNKVIKDLILDDTWVQVLDTRFYISTAGLIRRKMSYGQHFTFGTRVDGNYYVHGMTLPKGYSFFVHGLMASIFLNNSEVLPKGSVVDHIDTDPSNNNLSNLKLTDQKGNLNNPKSKKKLQKPIKCKNYGVTVYFRSISDCAKLLGLNHPGSICDWLVGRYNCTYPGFSDFEYLTSEEIELLDESDFITLKGELKFQNKLLQEGED